MSNIKWWELSPDKFESLCHDLLAFKYPSINCFGRQGPDAGIDALSKDGKTVFQCKFHQKHQRTYLFSDPKNEAKKIKRYKNRDDAKAKLWKKVKKWVLMTNLELNPQVDLNKWEKKVEPLFQDMGIEAELWGGEKLSSLLVEYPNVRRAYFEDQLPSLISVSKAKEELSKETATPPFVGRENEMQQVKSFLQSKDKRLLSIEGPGGIGKTRFLLETGQYAISHLKKKDVYWANTHTLELVDSQWWKSIPSRPGLLLIDEPSKISFLQVLIEQFCSNEGPLKNWKILITSRPETQIPLFLAQNSKPFIGSIELKSLKQKNGSLPIINFLFKDIDINVSTMPIQHKEKIIQWLAQASSGYPIWLVIGAKIIKDEKDTNALLKLPTDRLSLIEKYISQILQDVPSTLGDPKQFSDVLTWLALFQEIRIEEDQDIIALITQKSGYRSNQDVQNVIKDFHRKRFLKKLGRIYRINPDVMKDHILLKKLIHQDRPSDIAYEIIDLILEGDKGSLSASNQKKLIRTLSYTELLSKLSKKPISLLSKILNEIRILVKSNEAKDQMSAIFLMEIIAETRPKNIADLSSIIRKNESKPSEIQVPYWGPTTIKHKECVLKLPMVLFEATKYAIEDDERKLLIEELYHLAEYESKIEPHNKTHPFLSELNDGARTSNIFERLIFSDPYLAVSFENTIFKVINSKLDDILSKRKKCPTFLDAFRKLVDPFLSVWRMHVDFNGKELQLVMYALPENSLAFQHRSKFLSKLWEKLQESKNSNLLCFLLDLIFHSNKEVSHAKKLNSYFEKEEKEMLEKIRRFLERKNLSIKVLRKTQNIWQWHADYDKRKDYKSIAKKCEALFLANSKLKLLIEMDKSEKGPPQEKLAKMILNNEDSYSFETFIADVKEYVPDEIGSNTFLFRKVSPYIAEDFHTSEKVKKFVLSNLTSSDSYKRSLAMNIFAKIIEDLRRDKNEKEQSNLFNQIKQQLQNKSQQDVKDIIHLLSGLYDYHYNYQEAQINQSDLSFMTALLNDHILEKDNTHLEHNEICILNSAISSFFSIDKNMTKGILEKFFKTIDSKNRDKENNFETSLINRDKEYNFVTSLIRGLWTQDTRKVDINKEDIYWLIHFLMSEVHDLRWTQNIFEGELKMLLEKIQWRHPGFLEFCTFIKYRKENMEKYKNHAVPSTSDLSKLFQIPDITEENKAEFSKGFDDLLKLNNEEYPFGDYLPEWLGYFDPYGVFLPDKICSRLNETKLDVNEIYRLSRYAGVYEEDSEPWRKIAIASAQKTQDLDFNDRDRKEILLSFYPKSMKAQIWQGVVGQFSPRWQEAVDDAQSKYEQEENIFLKEYYKMRLDMAKRELEERRMRHLEEFGDE